MKTRGKAREIHENQGTLIAQIEQITLIDRVVSKYKESIREISDPGNPRPWFSYGGLN